MKPYYDLYRLTAPAPSDSGFNKSLAYCSAYISHLSHTPLSRLDNIVEVDILFIHIRMLYVNRYVFMLFQ